MKGFRIDKNGGAMMTGRRVIVFGTTGVGKISKDVLISDGEQVIAFADNDSSKWGTKVEGVEVIKPSSIPALSPDYVVLGMFKNRPVVTKQLLDMGIPRDKICIILEQRYIYKNPEKLSEEQLVTLDAVNYTSETQKQFESWNITVTDETFLSQVRRLKEVMYEYNIPLERICLVKGMVMVAHGIRPCKKNEDMDIIMSNEMREMYGRGKVFVDDNIEMDPIYYMHGRNNDDIIFDPDRHVVIEGIKVMTVKEMYAYKREIRAVRSERKGLLEDLQLMEKFLISNGISVNDIENQYYVTKHLPYRE